MSTSPSQPSDPHADPDAPPTHFPESPSNPLRIPPNPLKSVNFWRIALIEHVCYTIHETVSPSDHITRDVRTPGVPMSTAYLCHMRSSLITTYQTPLLFLSSNFKLQTSNLKLRSPRPGCMEPRPHAPYLPLPHAPYPKLHLRNDKPITYNGWAATSQYHHDPPFMRREKRTR
jgi:hypothetical protein